MTGIDIVHIPYKGFGQGIADVLANQVPLIFGGITASIPLIKAGKLKGLGVTSPQRSKALPDVPAIAETLPGFDIQAWYGFMAPAGTPREIVLKIHDDVVTIIRRPDFQERLAKDAHRAGRQFARGLRGADQGRSRALGQGRQGGGREARLAARVPSCRGRRQATVKSVGS